VSSETKVDSDDRQPSPIWDLAELVEAEATNQTGAKVVDGIQVSGNLLLDWKFIVITKK